MPVALKEPCRHHHKRKKCKRNPAERRCEEIETDYETRNDNKENDQLLVQLHKEGRDGIVAITTAMSSEAN